MALSETARECSDAFGEALLGTAEPVSVAIYSYWNWKLLSALEEFGICVDLDVMNATFGSIEYLSFPRV